MNKNILIPFIIILVIAILLLFTGKIGIYGMTIAVFALIFLGIIDYIMKNGRSIGAYLLLLGTIVGVFWMIYIIPIVGDTYIF